MDLILPTSCKTPPPPPAIQSEDAPDALGHFVGFVVAYVHRNMFLRDFHGIVRRSLGCELDVTIVWSIGRCEGGNGSKMGGLCRGYGGRRRRGIHHFLFLLSLPYVIVLMVSSILVIFVSTITTVLISPRRIRYLATIISLGDANLASLGPW